MTDPKPQTGVIPDPLPYDDRTSNEGPKRSDFQQAGHLPDCGAHCERIHGDQADPEADEIAALRRQLAEVTTERDALKLELAKTENGWRETIKDRDALEVAHDGCETAVDELIAKLATERKHRIAVERLLGEATMETCDGWNAGNLARLLIAERDGARAEAAAAKRERDQLRAAYSDPQMVRAAILRGAMAVPEDLVWLHDSHGPVAAIVAERDALKLKLEKAEIRVDDLEHANEERFLDSIAKDCHCRTGLICGGVQAGAPCDDLGPPDDIENDPEIAPDDDLERGEG